MESFQTKSKYLRYDNKQKQKQETSDTIELGEVKIEEFKDDY